MNAEPVLSTGSLAAGDVELEYLDSAGPRIIGLYYKGSINLFASVPELSTPTPFGDFHYFGGHRLWYAPEAMPRSYYPDDEGVEVLKVPNGILLQGKKEDCTGIRKSIEIKINPNLPQVTLKHLLVNESLWDVELAPWAITMFQLGGIAVLPFRPEVVDTDGLLPNRRISLWPYTKINDSRLRFDDSFIYVFAKNDLPLFKIGAFNPRGWIAYWNAGVLFRKLFDVQLDGNYPDHGSNAEIYCDENFLELESLTPLIILKAGSSISHTEYWELYDSPKQKFLPETAIRWIQKA